MKDPRLVFKESMLKQESEAGLALANSILAGNKRRAYGDPVDFYSKLFGWNQGLKTKRFAGDRRPFTLGYPIVD